MGKLIEACVPDIGDYRDVPVIEILVGPGDRVEANTTVVVLESDKATLDVPAGRGGLVEEVLVRAGGSGFAGKPGASRSQQHRRRRTDGSCSDATRNGRDIPRPGSPMRPKSTAPRLSPLRLRRWVRAVPLSGVWRES